MFHYTLQNWSNEKTAVNHHCCQLDATICNTARKLIITTLAFRVSATSGPGMWPRPSLLPCSPLLVFQLQRRLGKWLVPFLPWEGMIHRVGNSSNVRRALTRYWAARKLDKCPLYHLDEVCSPTPVRKQFSFHFRTLPERLHVVTTSLVWQLGSGGGVWGLWGQVMSRKLLLVVLMGGGGLAGVLQWCQQYLQTQMMRFPVVHSTGSLPFSFGLLG